METLDVTAFKDIRDYLRQTLAERRAKNSGYSLNRWSAELGLRFPGHLSNILNKRRPITPALADKFAENLGLSEENNRKFKLMVLYSQCNSPEQKALLAQALRDLNPSFTMQAMEMDQFCLGLVS